MQGDAGRGESSAGGGRYPGRWTSLAGPPLPCADVYVARVGHQVVARSWWPPGVEIQKFFNRRRGIHGQNHLCRDPMMAGAAAVVTRKNSPPAFRTPLSPLRTGHRRPHRMGLLGGPKAKPSAAGQARLFAETRTLGPTVGARRAGPRGYIQIGPGGPVSLV